jgi:hypothetical protein
MPALVGCGVIGNTADSGSVVLGSSPGTPANSSVATGVVASAGVHAIPESTHN